jgi:hypothetical protein
MLTISGTTQAISLVPGPFFQKTLNYEVGTLYNGGVDGTFYFRTAATGPVHTEEFDTQTYGAGDGTFADLVVYHPPGLKCDDGSYVWDGTNTCVEDAFGLLQITSIHTGNVTGSDSRFGDGIDGTPIGNDISESTLYWAKDVHGWLRGVMYGQQDQLVYCETASTPGPDMTWFTDDDTAGSYMIWSTGGFGDVYEMPSATYDPMAGGLPPWARTADDEFPGWCATTDDLFIGGVAEYFRFSGFTTLNEDDEFIFDGETEVVIDVHHPASKVGDWDNWLLNWWDSPDADNPDAFTPTGDIWQSWNLGDPAYTNGWIGSEDSGRGYLAVPIPEPVTMLGVFLGVSSLTGYLRRRKLA